MNAPIRFPTRRRIEHDVHGGLFREVMTHLEHTATFLDGRGRIVQREADKRGSLAYARASMILTDRLSPCAQIMFLARDWLDPKRRPHVELHKQIPTVSIVHPAAILRMPPPWASRSG